MAQSLLILGSAGLIGTAIRRAAARGYELISVDLAETPPCAGLTGVVHLVGEERYEADLGSPDEIDRLWREARIGSRDLAGVIDLVAYYDFRNRRDPRYGRVIRGLAHLLQRIGETLAPETPFVYASSMAAMAPTEPGHKLRPDSPRSGGWAYPRHKLEAEAIIERAEIPQPRVELVLAGVYSRWCQLVPMYQHIERVARGSLSSRFYPGPADRGLTYVHVDAVADAFLRAVDRLRSESGVHRFLIGEERPVTYLQLQEAASRAFHRATRTVRRIPKFLARLGARILGVWTRLRGKRAFLRPWMVDFAGEHFEFDLTATQRALGWQPDGYLGDRLEAICERAAVHRELWIAKNEARPR